MAGDDKSLSGSPGGSDDKASDLISTWEPRDVVLKSPGLYIGPLAVEKKECWAYDKESSSILLQELSYSPGLYKILDQALLITTASGVPTSLKVKIDQTSNKFSVSCSGTNFPLNFNKNKEAYIPQTMFSTFSLRNEFTGVFASIFSKKLRVRTCDGKHEYSQKINNNMLDIKLPQIVISEKPHNWIKVSLYPDLQKFSTRFDDNLISIMHKRVIDLACALGENVIVHVNSTLVSPMPFIEYVELYIGAVTADGAAENPYPRVYAMAGDWNVCLTLSDGEFQQVSLVNGIATLNGGTHVDCIIEQITQHLLSIINNEKKLPKIKVAEIKSRLWLFVNAKVDKPEFDSYSKETLINKKESYGCKLSDDFFREVNRLGIMDKLVDKLTSRRRSKHLKIDKLDDAVLAGSNRRNSSKCTLMLTEGDSAKSLAMTGRNILGKEHYGVFPMKGKFANAKKASTDQVKSDPVVQSIVQIMGLKYDQVYENTDGLRYGHIMIMTDQDHDGSHIKGLVINLFHKFWDSLLKVEGFLLEFITPIIKVTCNRGSGSTLFYSMYDYECWKKEANANANDWSLKYYKGLASHTDVEAERYFKEMDKHIKTFVWVDDTDDEAIDLAFAVNNANRRKQWLNDYNGVYGLETTGYIDLNQPNIRYRDFINKEMRLYLLADLLRSIPSMVDGLKPVQRKILFCLLKGELIEDIKVSDLTGYVSKNSAYLHGEQSLPPAIIGMAQEFVGSNNLNLLQPRGHFGTRDMGGKDAGSGRYIYTDLSPITHIIFPKEDDPNLNFMEAVGQCIEPMWYAPTVPMILINGTKGTATGWSTFVPKYNPREILLRLRNLINGRTSLLNPLLPWYRGFKGKVTFCTKKETGCNIIGVAEKTSDTTIRITEVPIGYTFKKYKDKLKAMLRSNRKEDDNVKGKEISIEKISDKGDAENVDIHVTLTPTDMKMAEKLGLEVALKLITNISTVNMHLITSTGKIEKFNKPEEIINSFYRFRLQLYEKRKATSVKNFETQINKLENQIRLVSGVLEGKYSLAEMDSSGQKVFLEKLKFDLVLEEGATSGYDYLLYLPMINFTKDSLTKLDSERKELAIQYNAMRAKEPSQLWLEDLDKFEEGLAVVDKLYEEARLKRAKEKAAKEITHKRKRTADAGEKHRETKSKKSKKSKKELKE